MNYSNSELLRWPDAQPITRAMILSHLRDADDDPDMVCAGGSYSEQTDHAQLLISDTSCLSDAPLQDALNHLEALREKERLAADWSMEYDYIPHCFHCAALSKCFLGPIPTPSL